MGKQVATFTCAAGHVQTMTFLGMNQATVELYCGLIDGTSPAYKYPPGADSAIGKCGICGAKITTKILTSDDNNNGTSEIS